MYFEDYESYKYKHKCNYKRRYEIKSSDKMRLDEMAIESV